MADGLSRGLTEQILMIKLQIAAEEYRAGRLAPEALEKLIDEIEAWVKSDKS